MLEQGAAHPRRQQIALGRDRIGAEGARESAHREQNDRGSDEDRVGNRELSMRRDEMRGCDPNPSSDRVGACKDEVVHEERDR